MGLPRRDTPLGMFGEHSKSKEAFLVPQHPAWVVTPVNIESVVYCLNKWQLAQVNAI